VFQGREIGTNDLDRVGGNAGGGQPVAEPHIVCPAGKGHGEGRRLGAAQGIDRRPDPREVGVSGAGQALIQGDRLAVAVQHHGDLQLGAGSAADSGVDGEGHAEEAVRGVQLAGDQLVADIRPRRLLGDLDIEAVLLEQAELLRHNDRCAVGKGDKADADRRSGCPSGLRRQQGQGSGSGGGDQRAAEKGLTVHIHGNRFLSRKRGNEFQR